MKCIILVSDCKMRTYPLNNMIRSLLPIRGKPILEHIIDKVQLLNEIEEIFIICGQRSFKQFKGWRDYFPNTTPVVLIESPSLYRNEDEDLKNLIWLINKEKINDDLLVIDGDKLCPFGFASFISYVLSNKYNLVLGVSSVKDGFKINNGYFVEADEKGRIIGLYKKPISSKDLFNPLSIHPVRDRKISNGVYFFPKDKNIFVKEYVSQNDSCCNMEEYVKWLIKKDSAYVFNFEGTYLPIVDMDSYTEAICSF